MGCNREIIFTCVYIFFFKEFKIFFSKTSQPISIQLCTNPPWVKGIQVCSDKWAGHHQRGDNHNNAKIGFGHPS
jgi:hypothetical protein